MYSCNIWVKGEQQGNNKDFRSWSNKYQEKYWEVHAAGHFKECVLDKLQKEQMYRCIVETRCWVGNKVVQNKNHHLPKLKGCHKVENLYEIVSSASNTFPPSIRGSCWFILMPYPFYVVVVFQFAIHYYILIEKCCFYFFQSECKSHWVDFVLPFVNQVYELGMS